MRVIERFLSGAVMAFAFGIVLGEEVRVVQPNDSLAATDVTRILEAQPAPRADSGAVPKTRSIRKVGAADAGGAPPGVAEASSLALRIQFDRDSATLPPDARAQLDTVALGIRALSGGPQILIEGHTDDTGSPDHNDRLSTQRAETVRAYLIERGVQAGWLTARGAGSRQPLAEEQPNAAANRRVEFKRINQ